MAKFRNNSIPFLCVAIRQISQTVNTKRNYHILFISLEKNRLSELDVFEKGKKDFNFFLNLFAVYGQINVSQTEVREKKYFANSTQQHTWNIYGIA